jgi:hypothetical protein
MDALATARMRVLNAEAQRPLPGLRAPAAEGSSAREYRQLIAELQGQISSLEAELASFAAQASRPIASDAALSSYLVTKDAARGVEEEEAGESSAHLPDPTFGLTSGLVAGVMIESVDERVEAGRDVLDRMRTLRGRTAVGALPFYVAARLQRDRITWLDCRLPPLHQHCLAEFLASVCEEKSLGKFFRGIAAYGEALAARSRVLLEAKQRHGPSMHVRAEEGLLLWMPSLPPAHEPSATVPTWLFEFRLLWRLQLPAARGRLVQTIELLPVFSSAFLHADRGAGLARSLPSVFKAMVVAKGTARALDTLVALSRISA